jgi:two-component system, OmpR family, sensor kinase
MSGPDAVSTSSLTRTALSAHPADSNGRIDAFDRLTADVRTPFTLESELEEPPAQRYGLPSGVLHELRTPLTSIHGYAQVLQRNLANPSRAANAVNVVARESVRLTEMLSLLSELTELESEDAAAPAVVADLREIVDGIVLDVQRRDGNQHPITVEGSGWALCNVNLTSRALLHVLTNAVRYSDRGRGVSVVIKGMEDHLEIAVADDGIGVPPGELERIFRPYARGSNAKGYGVRGLGLGLYLATEALRQTGGSITAEPGSSSGMVFRICLPRA